MVLQDPRNLEVEQAQPIESAWANPRSGTTTVFWRVLERIGKMAGGHAIVTDPVLTGPTTPVIDNANGAKFHEYYLQSGAIGGTARGFYMQFDGTGVGAVNTMQLWSVIRKAGAVSRGGSALHANAYLAADASCTGTIGELSGVHAHLIMEAEARNVQGSYYALKVANELKLGNVLPIVVALTNYQDVGPVWTPFFCNLSVTAGVGRCVETHSAVGATSPVFYLRVRCPDASVGYIPIYAQHQA